MKHLKFALLALTASLFLAIPAAPKASAQISIGIGVGEPACPYGYYGYAPYRCAPYGYYGPEWFYGGHFRGAGRWYHGEPFHGQVNRDFDPRYGYHGGFPDRGEYHDRPGQFQDFHGSHYSDPRGHYHGNDHHDAYDHHR
jgi:hypothetical protein